MKKREERRRKGEVKGGRQEENQRLNKLKLTRANYREGSVPQI